MLQILQFDIAAKAQLYSLYRRSPTDLLTCIPHTELAMRNLHWTFANAAATASAQAAAAARRVSR